MHCATNPKDTDAFVFSMYNNLKKAGVVPVSSFRAGGVVTPSREEGMKKKRKTKK
jgi:pyridoxal biosynthesis lyase PdxS